MNDPERTLGGEQPRPRSRREGEETLANDAELTIGHHDRVEKVADSVQPDRTIALGAAPAARRPVGAAEVRTALKAGTRLGSYVLIDPLGEGAQGSVWRAHNDVANRDFALKFLTAKQTRNAAAVRSMRSEASVLFGLTHPSIVRLNNIEQVGPHLFLVMELIEGSSVQSLLSSRVAKKSAKRRGFTVEECLWLLEQLAPALDYAASQKVTHRDIKPANLMLTAQVDPERSLVESKATVKVCDFGIAIVDLEAEASGRLSPAGTLPYMAPEVLVGEKPTTQADIYSLAATIYALHRGDPPYKGGTVTEMMKSHREGVLKPLDSGNKTFDAAIMKGLSKEPDDRQGSFDDFLYEASGGRLGRRAALRARGQRWGTLAASALALAAVGYALDPFGVRRGQAEFVLDGTLGDRDGAPVVREGALELQFDYSSPGDEEVDVQVDGGESVRIGPVEPGGERYRVVVTLLEQGSHEIALRGAERGTLIGQQRLYVDTAVELAADPIRLPESGPYDVQEPVVVEFYLDEAGVEVWDVTGGRDEKLELEVEGRRARTRLVVPSDPERQSWDVTKHFRFRDPFGNEEVRSTTFTAFDRGRILERIRFADPTPVADVHLWDIEQELAEVASIQEQIKATEKLIGFAEREELQRAAEARVEALNDKLRSAPAPTIEWPLVDAAAAGAVGGIALRSDGDVPLLFSRKIAPELRGRVTSSRSSRIQVVSERLTVDVVPEVARETGEFRCVVTLVQGTEGFLKLSLPDNGPIQLLRLAHDPDPPRIALGAPLDDAVVATSSVEFVVDVDDGPGASGVERVEVVVAGESYPLQSTGEQDASWRGTAQLREEGQSSCRIRAFDRVGNQAEFQFTVVRDTTPPSWTDSGELPQASTGRPVAMVFQFDETIATARATWKLLDAARATIAEGALSDDEVQKVLAAVEFSITLPFRPCEQLQVDLEVTDSVGNARKVTANRAVKHDPWGAVPEWIRGNAEAVLDLAELRRLLGDELTDPDDAYALDADGLRFPRCIRHKRSKIEFVFVPGGTFRYGPPPGAEVSMSSFYIARTEVSGRQFHAIGDFEGYSRDGNESSDLPIRTNRADASRWCLRQQFQLPTEAQWEYAASGPDNRLYPWGNDNDGARFNGPPTSPLAPRTELVAVDAFPLGRSWCGALQMAGNLFEICRDDLDPANVRDGAVDPEGAIDVAKQGYIVRGSSHGTSAGLETTAGRVEVNDARTLRRAGLRPVWLLKGN